MSRVADRNLLWGILALQMEFISRDALIGAMNAWALEKHRDLEDLLVDRGDLDGLVERGPGRLKHRLRGPRVRLRRA